jgi:ABC-type multidrug transport system ATPase subunit/ABC-type transport system involved in multi-copper enzyme maturation permease subunit
MIEIRHLTKRYGRRVALDDVSLSIQPGEVTLLLGPNGAGKSTLLRCLLGLTEYEGFIAVGGLDPIADGCAVRSAIGYMPQSGGLHVDLTVRQTMELYARIRGASVGRGARLLEEAGLTQQRETIVGELSGGMRQRLGFALALLADPPILVLDEPSSSLDAASRRWLVERLRAAAGEGRTIVVSTHAGQELLEAGDRTIVLDAGRLVATSKLDHLVAAPESFTSVPRVPVAAHRRRRLERIAPIAQKEVHDGLTNRWLIAYCLVLGGLGLAATVIGLDSAGGLAIQAFGRTTATLMNLCLLLSPLVAVVMGAASIASEQERGTLEHLLAQPLTRSELLMGKYVGLLVALTGATVAGFVPAGRALAAAARPGLHVRYALFPGIAALAGAAMTGVGVLISATSRSAVQAQGMAVFTWFAFVLLYDLVLMGSLVLSGMPASWLGVALVANPIDAARVLGILALEPDLYLLGPAGAFLTTRLTRAGAAILLSAALVLWAVVPVVAAAVTFSLRRRKHSYADQKRGAAAVGRGAERGDRVHVHQRIAGIGG